MGPFIGKNSIWNSQWTKRRANKAKSSFDESSLSLKLTEKVYIQYKKQYKMRYLYITYLPYK